MATFLFVSGAFHGGWCWDKVRPALEQAGHTVLTPTLTGIGERSHLAKLGLINLDTHIDDITNQITWNDLKDVVLVGHSYAGLVITGVADRIPERIGSLVYLDALLPEDGDSVLSYLPNILELFVYRSGDFGGILVEPLPADHFGLEAVDEAWVDANVTPHPLACFTQKIRLTGAFKKVTQRVFIHDTRMTIPTPFREKYEAQLGTPGAQIFALDGGHDLMVSQPDEVSDILLKTL